jgi:purine-binding chemotaxis protein CheW
VSAASREESAALALRRAFDRTFAASSAAQPLFEDLLAVRVAGDAFALRLRDVAELVAGLLVVPLPSATPHLLGLAGLRGGVVPVFSLATLLGAAGPTGAPRWAVLCRAAEPFALAFDAFEGHLRLPAASLFGAADDPGAARRCLCGLARAPGGDRGLVDLPLISHALSAQSGPALQAKEQ